MATNSAAEFRARATQARRIADNMDNLDAQIGMRDMAEALDAEADRLEGGEPPNLLPPPIIDS